MKSLDVLNLYKLHVSTFSAFLESRVEKNLDRDCLVFDKNKTSWLEFHQWVAGLSLWLSEQNLQLGDKVAIVSRNSDLYVGLIFALADQGLVVVPVNPDLTEKEAEYVLTHADAKLVLCESDFADSLKASLANLNIPFRLLDDSLRSLRSDKLQYRAQPESTFLILYTSGTTGFPKGVMHSQRTAVMAGEAFVERMLLTPDDRVLCILPFFHINALFYSLMGSFAAGSALLITRKFSASQFWQQASELGATQVNIIAAIGNILSQRARTEFVPTHSIRKIYGAPVSAQIEKVFREEFKVPQVLEGYGMTEIPGAINNQLAGAWKVGTMGMAARHPDASLTFTELQILDENDQPVAPGEAGELVVKTPLLMQGYYKDPAQTKESFTADGYFRTGDLVRQDAEGYYVFVTRKKDIIRRRGENISGAEIDRCVGLHPQIAECAAIGVPSPLGEEEIFLAIVVRTHEQVSEQEIYRWCEIHLSKIKCPKFIKRFASLPHTPTARVAKFKLKQLPDLMANAVEF